MLSQLGAWTARLTAKQAVLLTSISANGVAATEQQDDTRGPGGEPPARFIRPLPDAIVVGSVVDIRFNAEPDAVVDVVDSHDTPVAHLSGGGEHYVKKLQTGTYRAVAMLDQQHNELWFHVINLTQDQKTTFDSIYGKETANPYIAGLYFAIHGKMAPAMREFEALARDKTGPHWLAKRYEDGLLSQDL